MQSLYAFGAMFGLTIQRIGEGNPIGQGTIETDGNGRFRWTAPGSIYPGPWVTVQANGTFTLPDGDNPSQGLRVAQNGASPARGRAPITALDIYNGHVGLANVLTAARAAGESEYRALFIKNVSLGILSLNIYLNQLGTPKFVDVAGYGAAGAVSVPIQVGAYDWPSSGFAQNENSNEVMYYTSMTPTALTVPAAGRDVWGEVAGGIAGVANDVIIPVPGLRIATENPASQPAGAIQRLPGLFTAPSGRTFVHPANNQDANMLTVASLLPSNIIGLWFQRKIIAGATATAHVWNQICVDSIT